MSEAAGTWTDNELDALVDTYLQMLRLELTGEAYNKRKHNLALQAVIRRSHASIEFKLGNLSAVLDDLGKPYIYGYKPRIHYQSALRSRVEARLHEFPDIPGETHSDHGRSRERHGTEHPTVIASEVPPPAAEGSFPMEPDASAISQQEANSEQSNEFWRQISKLWARSTGGADVAAKPDDPVTNHLPVAPSPAGVDEACAWFSEGLNAASLSRILLLVGGPGAGKSHATSSLVAPLKKLSPIHDGLAHRQYKYEVGSKTLTLINDATIPSDEYPDAPLTHEINEAASKENHLIACVNRGILVEETKRLSSVPSIELNAGEAFLKWLQREELVRNDDQVWEIRTSKQEDYASTGYLLHQGEIIAEVVVIYVDVCSLLERRPSITLGNSSNAATDANEKYIIGGFAQRLKWGDDRTPAGVLLEKVVSPIVPLAQDEAKWNPVAANIASLASVGGRAGVLAVLRGAEIAAGKRFTYREVWGALVRCILGVLPEVTGSRSVLDYLSQRMEMPEEPIARFRRAQELASIRFSQALFEAGATDQSSDPRGNPITRMTGTVDPMRDAVPGHYSVNAASGWANPLTEAFSGPSVVGSPLHNLTEGLEVDDTFHLVRTDFDHCLDSAFKEAMQSENLRDADRYAFIKWYGMYLGRLYAVANGVPAFRREIGLWAESWTTSPNLPNELGDGLRTLLRPKRRPKDTDSASLIPILDSRTNPVVGTLTDPKLALVTGDVEMKSMREAESLFLVLSEHGNEISRMPLDFPLIREATACGEEYPGMTELSETTSPRLERFRAARLVPKQLHNANYRMVYGDKDAILALSKGDE